MAVSQAARICTPFAIALVVTGAAQFGAAHAQGPRGQPPPAPPSPEAAAVIARHIDAARELAGTDLTVPFEFFCVAGNARPNSMTAPPLTPARLFDNLYVAGNSETVVYAITTSAGIVLIDAGFANEVETVLVPGLEALGLDPADVEYILLGHGHSDHFGGAAWFQQRHGTRVGTTAADWETIAQTSASTRPGEASTPQPTRDLVIEDGKPIVVGDTTITPVAVPGHTPGSLAFIFDVEDGGERHVAGLFGGTVLSAGFVSTPGLEQYVASIGRYREVARELGVDVEIQNHPIFDDTPARLAALAGRQRGDPHPFVMGTERYLRFWGIVAECMQTEIVLRKDREAQQ